MSLLQEQLEEMRKQTQGAGVTPEMVQIAAAQPEPVPQESLLSAPLSPIQKIMERDGKAKTFGKMLLGGFTGMTPLLMPELIGSRDRYKQELKDYAEQQGLMRTQEQAKVYQDMLYDDDPSNDMKAMQMGAIHQPDVYGPVLRDRMQQQFNPDPATYTEGKWQFDPNHDNGEGENKGAWYLERQASDGTTKKDYADPNFRPQVAMPGADYIDKEIGSSQEKLFGHQGNAQGARNVIGQMEEIGEENWTSGIQAKAGEAWKYYTGSEGYLTSVRKNYSDIKVRNAIGNLPPGVASDKDIELVMEPWPEGTSSYGFIKRKLEAIARLEEGRAAYRAFEADYISKNRRRDGLAKAWADTDHAKKIAGDNVPAPTMKWKVVNQ